MDQMADPRSILIGIMITKMMTERHPDHLMGTIGIGRKNHLDHFLFLFHRGRVVGFVLQIRKENYEFGAIDSQPSVRRKVR